MTYYIDDSMFALMMRFIGFSQDMSFENQGFLKRQLKEIKEYVGQCDPYEKNFRAIKWIELYADEYRKSWNKKIITDKFLEYRCPDCPICGDSNSHEHCQIHNKWLELLQKYITKNIESQEYVEETLKLLSDNKEHLKIKLSHLTFQ